MWPGNDPKPRADDDTPEAPERNWRHEMPTAVTGSTGGSASSHEPPPSVTPGNPHPAPPRAPGAASRAPSEGIGDGDAPVRGRRRRRRPEPEDKGPLAFLRELPALLLVAFVLALLIKSFLVQAFYIPSASMENTLQIGDRVLVNKLVYRFHPPRRGDVIVFEDPNPAPQPDRGPVAAFVEWLTEGLGVSAHPEKDFIKRVIGLPGETIEVDRGRVYVNGRPLEEPYVNPFRDVSDYPPTRVPPNALFVMGDNRANSNDSRRGLGFIPYDKVVGRAFVIIWPPQRAGLLNDG